jgi:DNA-binding MarR family transcriptional regulator
MQINKTEKMAQYTKNEPESWKRKGFTRLPTWALHDKRLGRADILVLAALLSRAFKGKECTFPSLTTITKESRYSRKSVIQAIKNLEACGYIAVTRAKRGSRKTNRYSIIWSGWPGG